MLLGLLLLYYRFAYTCKCAGHLIEVLITPDEYPEEITWSVRSPAAIEDGASSHGR